VQLAALTAPRGSRPTCPPGRFARPAPLDRPAGLRARPRSTARPVCAPGPARPLAVFA